MEDDGEKMSEYLWGVVVGVIMSVAMAIVSWGLAIGLAVLLYRVVVSFSP